MDDESKQISSKTWARAVSPIQKAGYADGVVDGNNSAFQSCFDMGYKEGFHYGFQIGYKNAILKQRNDQHFNCIICSDSNEFNSSVCNLYNLQKERNHEKLNIH
ncbi:unnamed protein product [Leptosia nina]|uniref:Essential protein Yae1 N-terminal domain-containing protein n=1 Tax=Leptosia nina TaxID=320188 RepID=A0AAV1JPG4_9NEOP